MGKLLAAVAILLAGSFVTVVGLPSVLPPAGMAAPALVASGEAIASASALPAVLPVPNPGWLQRITTPRWPPDLTAHMNPSAVTNQCVAGALATWAAAHRDDPRWDRPPPLLGNAIDLFGIATAEGFQLSRQPVVGSMVVYGGAYGLFGHIATVVAAQGNRYEVIEQNFLDYSPAVEPHWQTFDLRSIAWPDPAVIGFVVAPR